MSLSRRHLLIGTAATIGAALMPAAAQSQVSDDPADWLRATRHINHQHAAIRDAAASLTTGLSLDRDKALAIFGFVRSEIEFGFTSGFWDNKASDVMKSRTGYCNTKSTVFTALLRAAGVPARQVFVDIHASVLSGILDPGTPYFDHSYVEVFVWDTWVATDAYIVDEALFSPAQVRALREERLMGYGVHSSGTTDWDGHSPTFSQFNLNDPRPISMKEWGVFEDVADFYRRAEGTWNRLNPMLRAGMGTLASSANRRADALRGT